MSDVTNLSPLCQLLEEVRGYGRLREKLEQKEPVSTAVAEGAKPLLLAALYHHLATPLLIITATPETARSLYDSLASWARPDSFVMLLPEPDGLPYERLLPDPATVRDRLKALWALANPLVEAAPPLIIASAWAAAARTIPYPRFREASFVLKRGMKIELTSLIEKCLRLGYELESAVEVPGTISRRGGIVDLFPPISPHPLRLEFLGNTVESLRLFDPLTQRSMGEQDTAPVSPAAEMLPFSDDNLPLLALERLNPQAREKWEQELALLREGQRFPEMTFYAPLFNQGAPLDYLPPTGMVVLDEPGEIAAMLTELDERSRSLKTERGEMGELPTNFPTPYLTGEELQQRADKVGLGRVLRLTRWGGQEALPFTPAPNFKGQWGLFIKQLRHRLSAGERVILVSHQAQRLSELLWDENIVAPLSDLSQLPQPGTVKLISGLLPQGWLLGEPAVALFSDAEIFGVAKERRQVKKRPLPRSLFLAQIKPGDFVVHVEHGIARFAGTTRLKAEHEERDYLVLEYAEGDRLFVPVEQIERVSRYIGAGDQPPALSRLGTEEWHRAKERVKRATQEVAKELLELYATRQVAPGFAFSPDTTWQEELEASFPYVETPDQAEAVLQVKRDMELSQPMDRLVCGDVGYGKTEVALRAAFKTVMDGKQVAVLVPTTVLAQQHFNTFSQRLAPYPIRVEVLSRFRSEREQGEILTGLREGKIDICIGTHRLLQKDVAFKDLGLVVVDEEQRFGVKHKERLKQIRREVDVLTLSATPIPRTFYLSLAGVRDMSLIETPPEERQPVKTAVGEYDDRLVREAILRELERGGQVFYVYNRVQRIREVAGRLATLVPEATFAIGHGQMDEEDLERVMVEFAQGKPDVLVCTTIIESGLDMPNVNTLIVEDADRLGLTQLYQLRGRVGRGGQRAYAYFFYRRGKHLTPQAQKRLQTIYEATELGAGYQIALRDLEIRGAGNLLGVEQSGHMGAVGFELYCQLLAQAVEELKTGQPLAPPAPEPSLSLPLPAFFPEDYIPEQAARLSLYRRLAGVRSAEEVAALAQEMADRFGPLPHQAQNLLYAVRMRLLARRAGLEAVATEGADIVLRYPEGKTVNRSRLAPAPGLKIGIAQVRLSRPAARDWKRLLERVLEQLTRAAEAVR